MAKELSFKEFLDNLTEEVWLEIINRSIEDQDKKLDSLSEVDASIQLTYENDGVKRL